MNGPIKSALRSALGRLAGELFEVAYDASEAFVGVQIQKARDRREQRDRNSRCPKRPPTVCPKASSCRGIAASDATSLSGSNCARRSRIAWTTGVGAAISGHSIAERPLTERVAPYERPRKAVRPRRAPPRWAQSLTLAICSSLTSGKSATGSISGYGGATGGGRFTSRS